MSPLFSQSQTKLRVIGQVEFGEHSGHAYVGQSWVDTETTEALARETCARYTGKAPPGGGDTESLNRVVGQYMIWFSTSRATSGPHQ